MFSFLDMVNHYLGYFNINVTLKSRIYTILGILGDLYLFYVAVRFLANGYLSRGLLFLLVALVLLYFAVCNLFYYFTNRQPRFDITPKIVKALHISPRPSQTQGNSGMGGTVITNNIPANGMFDDRHVMPAKVTSTPEQQANIKEIVAILKAQGLLREDYNGNSDRQITDILKAANGKPAFAIGDGVLLPYFDMERIDDRYVVYAGLNKAERLPVGEVSRVGLQSIKSIDREQIKFFLASVTIVGGPYKEFGRSSLMEHQKDYEIAIKVAYSKR
ncbi:DUF6681 family protein [Lentilactobacillus sp. SPB1-3]|uniref:DUF6681 family protein n=1 Tax=Lentilactobacillus terminaliae TaxID=3003483 RepID=A0ACD5DGE2_9LACO|nr:DUF6681 family protein [Lentilactobacillus sp. SPB1-3]MCZ0976654.1 hypothetical protein [Lentilactobacillus sp. SPB1-3]